MCVFYVIRIYIYIYIYIYIIYTLLNPNPTSGHSWMSRYEFLVLSLLFLTAALYKTIGFEPWSLQSSRARFPIRRSCPKPFFVLSCLFIELLISSPRVCRVRELDFSFRAPCPRPSLSLSSLFVKMELLMSSPRACRDPELDVQFWAPCPKPICSLVFPSASNLWFQALLLSSRARFPILRYSS